MRIRRKRDPSFVSSVSYRGNLVEIYRRTTIYSPSSVFAFHRTCRIAVEAIARIPKSESMETRVADNGISSMVHLSLTVFIVAILRRYDSYEESSRGILVVGMKDKLVCSFESTRL